MKAQIISDATPLIHLAKINKLPYLRELYKEILIPKKIYEEIVIKGKRSQEKEVFIIEKLIEEKFIIVKEVSNKLDLPHLHEGEREAISLCKEMKIDKILIDDNDGFETAEFLKIKPLRTTALILRMLNKNIINFKEYQEVLIQLSNSGYYMRLEVYEELLKAGKEIAKK